MPEKPTNSGDKLKQFGVEDSLSDVDKLIAEAEAAMRETQLASVAEEMKTTTKKKKESEKSAERAEQLQHWFSALRADDSFVEDNGYEWVLKAAENLTGVASPEKSRELIEALRKSGDMLRKFGAVEPKSDALLYKMDALQKLHDTLFEQTQTMTTDALDAVKKKYKGEETEFERRYIKLIESPLVRGIEFDVHSPEAREKALKQEIIELILSPVAEIRLKDLEKKIADKKIRIDYLKKNELFSSYDTHKIQMEIETLKSLIEKLEKHLSRERLAFEVNRLVVEEILKDEHNEAELHVGFTELRSHLEVLRKNNQYVLSHQEWKTKAPAPKSKIAQNIIGVYVKNAVSMPEFSFYQIGKNEDRVNNMSPADQMLKIRFEKEFRNIDNYPSGYLQAQVHLFQVPKGKEGKLRNLKLAYSRIDNGLQNKKDEQVSKLPEAMIDEGWKESKLGAFVEPEQNVRDVDREYAGILEQLSQPQTDAERAFDIRGSEGEFHVYTLEQAVSLLRRARRDARDIVLDSEQDVAKLKLQSKSSEDLNKEVQIMKVELELRIKEVAERESELKKQFAREREEAIHLAQLSVAETRAEENRQSAREREEAVRKAQLSGKEALTAESAKSQEVLRSVVTQLKSALGNKSGLFGGDKNLREAVEALVSQMEGKF